ncbi:MAG TPA: DUF1080 domain-containing protein [Pirellulales bacterium]|nr:DUF1080 domain-containing protein [Pirellulales bacterium]
MKLSALLIAAGMILSNIASAADKDAAKDAKAERPLTPGGVWHMGDKARPKPRVIDPGKPEDCEGPARAPSDAIVLIGNGDLSAFQMRPRGKKGAALTDPTWKIDGDFVEVVPNSGDLLSNEKFGDCQIHVEWATSYEPMGKGQARGNSGVLLPGHVELQILDSYENETYADGQAAAIYHRYPPLVNASRKPGEWQTFDIMFLAPRFDDKDAKKIVTPARVTVLHNGILVHHDAETGGTSAETQIVLQDHLTPVRFRNVWVRRLKGYDE